MASSVAQLQDELLAGQKLLARGLARLHRGVRQRQWAQLRKAALRFDQEIGSHMRFLEESLLPRVAPELDPAERRRLENDGRDAARLLERLLLDREPGAGDWADLARGLRCFVDHAIRCGELARRLGSFGGEECEAVLAELAAGRKRTSGWVGQGG